MNQDTIEYILQFLTGQDLPPGPVNIGYTSNEQEFSKYDLVIVPSGFFDSHIYGTRQSIPACPLQEIEGIPLLFGENKTETHGTTIVTHADLIASTYFLITRYEEWVNPDQRDVNGRFPGKQSLPYRAGFIHRPIIDEYRRWIRKQLKQHHPQLPDLREGFQKVYLTHDVDAPFLYRSWKGAVRSLLDGRGLVTTLKNKFGRIDNDPYFTFPWLLTKDKEVQHALGANDVEIIFFVKGGGKVKQDKPVYHLFNTDIQRLLQYFQQNQAHIGLHASYYSGLYPEQITEEKENLILALPGPVHYNRHHYLSSREPKDMEVLSVNGITDDFTLGYADVAGFRLGTSHPVRWIDPSNGKLSNLTLHPLSIMDCTLDRPAYMGLSYEAAADYCRKLMQAVRHAGGELVLLWHNTSVTTNSNSYHRQLYSRLLQDMIAWQEDK